MCQTCSARRELYSLQTILSCLTVLLGTRGICVSTLSHSSVIVNQTAFVFTPSLFHDSLLPNRLRENSSEDSSALSVCVASLGSIFGYVQDWCSAQLHRSGAQGEVGPSGTVSPNRLKEVVGWWAETPE